MVDGLGDPNRLLAGGKGLRETPQLDQGSNQNNARQDPGQYGLAETLVGEVALQQRHATLENVDGAAPVRTGDMGLTEIRGSHRLDVNHTGRRAVHDRALSRRHRPVVLGDAVEEGA